jgi:ribonuclease Z
MPTWGMKISKEDKELRIDKSFILKYNPSIEQIHSIKRGGDYICESGKVMKNKEITLPLKPIKTYVYCSDTAYNEKLINHVKNADLLYHEATFDNSMEELAKDKFHSTSAHAATLAKEAGVGQLLLGHYSARFEDLSELLTQAQVIFPKTALSEEGKSYTI